MNGIPTLWNCELELFQRNLLKQNFPETKQYEDIRELRNPGYVDIISGGFPCQDISIAGKGTGIVGERSGLWSEMFRIVREVRPRYVLIENSPMLLVRGFERVLCDLSQSGMMRNGNVYRTPFSVSLIGGCGCTYVHTPTKSDGIRYRMKLQSLVKKINGSKFKDGNLAEYLANHFGVKITPSFCEWIMGFPIMYTVLKPSEMPSIR